MHVVSHQVSVLKPANHQRVVTESLGTKANTEVHGTCFMWTEEQFQFCKSSVETASLRSLPMSTQIRSTAVKVWHPYFSNVLNETSSLFRMPKNPCCPMMRSTGY